MKSSVWMVDISVEILSNTLWADAVISLRTDMVAIVLEFNVKVV